MNIKKKKFFPITPSVWKRSTVAMLCLVLVGLCLSCVKQKNCDCGLKGKFVYFEKPEKINFCCNYDVKVNAVFFSNSQTEFYRCYIVGSVPENFKTKDTVNVSVCLKEDKNNPCYKGCGLTVIYKLKCIEKED